MYNFISIGDAGYPLEPYIMTPYRSASGRSPESRYNVKHSQTRNIVERVIGRLKTRFRCLLSARQLHYTPRKSTKILNVCAALHNLCEMNAILLADEQIEEDVNIPQEGLNFNYENLHTSATIRDRIRDSLM